MLLASVSPAEREQIARVWHVALQALPAGPPAPPADQLLQRLSSGDLVDCHLCLIRDESRIVAFAAYHMGQAWLRQLFVDPGLQGSGLGTQLLASVMQAMPHGWLRTDEDNHQARRFYLRRGLRVRRIGPHPVTGAPTVEFEWP